MGRSQSQRSHCARRLCPQLRRLCPGCTLGGTLRLYRQRSSWVGGGLMTYSYTQISQYLSCPRRYKHRYLDGWKEKDTRAAMMFGRAFEQAVAAYFQRKDAAAALYQEWSTHRDSGLHYSERDSWDRMLQSGVQLLDRFAQDDRIRICQPRRNLQIKYTTPL